MQRILFVDDEQRLLDGLSRMLRPNCDVWEMTFVLGGQAALAAIETGDFDIVICDMRMPVVDGLAVLRHARERSPRTVRIALSGQTDLDVMSHSLSVVHQFLSKPCSPATLRSVIERVSSLQTALSQPALQAIVGQMAELPSLPRTYQQFAEAMEDSETTIRDIVAIVERDVALAARCLQLANSAYFGLRRRLDALDQAVLYLGVSTLRGLVLSSAVFSALQADSNLTHAELERLERHSLLVANIAKQLPEREEERQQAFMAGMLHDIGRLVLATAGADAACERDEPDPADREQAMPAPVTAITHAEVGAYLLGLWGFPLPIVEAVAFHHCPRRAASGRLDVLGAVYIANELMRENSAPAPAAGASTPSALTAYLESIGSADRLSELRAIAASVLGGSSE